MLLDALTLAARCDGRARRARRASAVFRHSRSGFRPFRSCSAPLVVVLVGPARRLSAAPDPRPNVGGLARAPRLVPGHGRGGSRFRGHASRRLHRRALRGRHDRAGAEGQLHADVRSVRQPAGAVRRRLVRLDRARRLRVGSPVRAAAQHRVLSGAADADAAGRRADRLERAGAAARAAHGAGAVGRRLHLARGVPSGAGLPVAADAVCWRAATRPPLRRCCWPPIRSRRSSTRRTRRRCSCSDRSAPSITFIGSDGCWRRCSGCSSASAGRTAVSSRCPLAVLAMQQALAATGARVRARRCRVVAARRSGCWSPPCRASRC